MHMYRDLKKFFSVFHQYEWERTINCGGIFEFFIFPLFNIHVFVFGDNIGHQ